MTPTFGPNSSSRDLLMANALDAMDALRKAIETVQYLAPHGRDYHTRGPEALPAAQAEHTYWLASLEHILEGVTATAEHIDQQ